jgi:hypothetical protein
VVHVRKDLVWDYDVPEEPERDAAFMALYVARVLERGTAEDVRSLGVEAIRRYLDVAPAPRKVIEFWRWWLAWKGDNDGDSHSGAEAAPSRFSGDRARSR